MGPPFLLLLLLLTSLKTGSSEDCKKPGFFIKQQPKLLAPEGNAISIPFSFGYPWKLATASRVHIAWRWKDFHGDYIYNTSSNFTHQAFKHRLFLNLSQYDGSLRIENLRKKDATTYFCRVQVDTENCGMQVWGSTSGTKLKIIRANKIPITRRPTTSTASITNSTTVITTVTMTAGLDISQGSGSGLLSLVAVVGMVMACVVLITTILGLIFYFRWKRSKGLKTEARIPDRESFQAPEEKDKNTGNKGQHTDLKLDPKDDGITYASLALSRLNSPVAPHSYPPQERPQEETLYSVIKTK
ncbi:paired immunoglobulin-like type 2 receptor alpha isoform X1 [Erinaceus europaeus]|uniref:paired immunoglobulin-like type 2 receptor alpha isoform X1 n=1 Tax=Erinaceus europaeus TaxID=9365 RepID=UPI0004447C5E|nr:paired immunoglobulin-like type 2 receptor alpha isoform X1 [Erinaceus europaeus]